MSTDSDQERVAEIVRAGTDPWMDVLLLGLSPEIFAAAEAPIGLITVKPGRSLPRSPLDAVFSRSPGPSDREVHSVWGEIRCGGHLTILSSPDGESLATPSFADGCLVEEITLPAGTKVRRWRRDVPGQSDHVGLRRDGKRLALAPDRLELLLRDVSDREARVPAWPDGRSVREVVATLGSRDRHHYAARIAALLGLAELAPHGTIEIPPQRLGAERRISELLVRFRHFRSQFREILEPALSRLESLGPETLSALASELRTWRREEDPTLDALARWVAGR